MILHSGQLGALSCITAALLWAVAVAMFRSSIDLHGAHFVNLAKSLLATMVLAVVVAFGGDWAALFEVPPTALLALAGSGLLGVTIGDTALFAAVGRIGVHRALLLQTTAPMFTAALAAGLGEELNSTQIAAGAIVLVGVGLVVLRPAEAENGLASSGVAAGVCLAVLAAAGQGGGVVLAKIGLEQTPALAATLVKLVAGTVGLLLAAAVGGRLMSTARALGDRATLRRVVPPSLLGTVIAMVLQMVGVALAPATVAAVLLSTTPVFSLVIDAWVERRPPTAMAVAGTLMAVAGISVLTWAG